MQGKRKLYTVCLATMIFFCIFIFSFNVLVAETCQIDVKTSSSSISGESCKIDIATSGECNNIEVEIKSNNPGFKMKPNPRPLNRPIPLIPKDSTYTLKFLSSGNLNPETITIDLTNGCDSTTHTVIMN